MSQQVRKEGYTPQCEKEYYFTNTPKPDWYVVRLILPPPEHWRCIANGTAKGCEELINLLQSGDIALHQGAD